MYTMYACQCTPCMLCPCTLCVTYYVAAYLSHFRADAIVADAEAIRAALIGADGKWSLLGQSFGEAATNDRITRASAYLTEPAQIHQSDEARFLNSFRRRND